MMPAMRLHHAGMSVADLDAMVAWYGAALGLAVEDRFEVPGAGLRGAMMAAPGALRVELLERAGSEPVARDLSSPPAALLSAAGATSRSRSRTSTARSRGSSRPAQRWSGTRGRHPCPTCAWPTCAIPRTT